MRIKRFESFGNEAEEIDSWIESNRDYINELDLENKLKEKTKTFIRLTN